MTRALPLISKFRKRQFALNLQIMVNRHTRLYHSWYIQVQRLVNDIRLTWVGYIVNGLVSNRFLSLELLD